MCGIAGIWYPPADRPESELLTDVTRMTERLRHRGPDDAGWWVDPAHGIGLGHRRLAILDLSAAGHQPMHSFDERWVLSYNGEIYNHQELRHELQQAGVKFRGSSDTETLVNALAVWGVPQTLRRCRGIFAWVAWDRQERQVIIARDHLGIKPLYYGWWHGCWLIASELKSLRALSHISYNIRRDVIPHYLRHNYIPAPYSIYQGVYKLPAGCWGRLEATGQPTVQAYWSFTEVARQGVETPPLDWNTAVETCEHVLREAVREQLLADVPLGAFLSGGIDSSLVVALMQQVSPQPVKTFSMGFELADYNEAPYARRIAQHLGTDHTEYYVTVHDALQVVPQLAEIYDEPFADSSQIPTWLVCRLARQHVTVALSGDGGDELFGGYPRYFAPLLTSRWGKLPTWTRWPIRRISSVVGQFTPGVLGRRLRRLAQILEQQDPDQRYLDCLTHWPLQMPVVRDAQPLQLVFQHPEQWPEFPPPLRWMWLDTLNYLPDDILVKVDRASMSVSLEVRVPLLDPRVVAAAWKMPVSFKCRGWQGKRLLRAVLSRHVPPHLFERPKMGFGVPLANWLRGGLRDWAEALLHENRLQREGFFDPVVIRQHWQEHLQGKDHAYRLWDVLMFQSWLEHQA
ncbi:MAG: asparagine synthetase B [Planctomycetaceae bacterium]|nr:MAG: asparagine synthetase B [Planctomycetaceae bacterium]